MPELTIDQLPAGTGAPPVFNDLLPRRDISEGTTASWTKKDTLAQILVLGRVATLTDLKGVDVTMIENRQHVLMLGSSSAGDGGGGYFYYNSGSSAIADDVSIVAPNAGSGRWFRTTLTPVASETQTKTGNNTLNVLTPTSVEHLPLPFYLRNSWNKLYKISAETEVAQLRVLAFGDSMSGYGVGALPAFFVQALSNAYGTNGAGTALTLSSSGSASSGDSSASGDTSHYTRWPSSLPPSLTGAGGTLTYGKGGGTVRCNTLKVYYIKEPGAGTFKVQSSADGSSWSDEAGYTSVNASNGSTALGIITISKTLGSYMLRVVGISGTTYFLPAGTGQFRNTAESGVEAMRIEVGGLALANANLSSQAVLTAWLQDAQPDLGIFEMKETDSTFAADLAAHQTRFDAGTTSMDWIYIGSSPVASNDANQVSQNAILRAHAVSNGLGYWDGYRPMRSYAIANALGWITDGVHRSAAGSAYLAWLLARDTHFFDGAFATYPGSIAGKRGAFTTSLTLGNLAGGDQPLVVAPEQVFNLDAKFKARRWLDFTKVDGTIDDYSWRFAFDDGATFSYTPTFLRIGRTDPGPYLQRESATMIGSRIAPNQTAADLRVRKLMFGDLYTVATLPSASSVAGITFVSDATNAAGTGMGSAPTGGGSVIRAVYSNGSAWLLL